MDYKGNRKDSDSDRVQEYATLRVELAKKKNTVKKVLDQ